ncbi:unnamed protein product [Sphagnum jensenii]|uniref:UspA domain-containing protein n=1 Tax=Sphagnum jensenii TaxID=128206 RepID=A0ABP0XFT3_9BRYO
MNSSSTMSRDHHVPYAAASVLVVLDANNKDITAAPLYWALGNVVRKGDYLKIFGIITTSTAKNTLGLGRGGDEIDYRNRSMQQLQNQVNIKKQALNSIPHVTEWCEKAGVKLEIDVKAGLQAKVIAVDEAKAMGAYHVILDSNMKKDKKYFVDNLTCFVSRLKNSGGVDTIRTFTMSVMDSASSNPTSKASTLDTSASTEFGHNTIRSSSSTSSASFDLLTCDSSEDLNQFSTQDSETLSWPRTDHDSSPILDKPLESHNSQADFQNKVGMIRSTSLTRAINLEPGLRVINPVLRPVKTSVDTIAAGESAGPTPVVTLWLASQASNSDGVVNINPENHRYTASPTVSLLHPPSGLKTVSSERDLRRGGQGTQASGSPRFIHGGAGSFSHNSRSLQAIKNQVQADNMKMDMYWPILEWADCRRSSRLKTTSQTSNLGGGSNLNIKAVSNLLASVRRRHIASYTSSSSLLYNDMVDSD